MSKALDAVRDQIKGGFGSIALYTERYDPAVGSTVISFQAGANKFAVEIMKDFENDYESGLVAEDHLSGLAIQLRGSESKRVIVSTRGVVSCDLPPADT